MILWVYLTPQLWNPFKEECVFSGNHSTITAPRKWLCIKTYSAHLLSITLLSFCIGSTHTHISRWTWAMILPTFCSYMCKGDSCVQEVHLAQRPLASFLFWLLLTMRSHNFSCSILGQTVHVLRHQWAYSCEKAKLELGYNPRSLKEGLSEMLHWLKNLGEIKFWWGYGNFFFLCCYWGSAIFLGPCLALRWFASAKVHCQLPIPFSVWFSV